VVGVSVVAAPSRREPAGVAACATPTCPSSSIKVVLGATAHTRWIIGVSRLRDDNAERHRPPDADLKGNRRRSRLSR
jgi:hypothetical protein